MGARRVTQAADRTGSQVRAIDARLNRSYPYRETTSIMRIHTRLEARSVRIAAHAAGVTFARMTEHGSRKSTRAFDVILEGHGRTKWGNSGTHGAASYTAATWDEWGIFLGRVFDYDPAANATYYRDADDFHWQTGERFKTLTPAQQHTRHTWNWNGDCVTGSYSVHECKCGAIMRRTR